MKRCICAILIVVILLAGCVFTPARPYKFLHDAEKIIQLELLKDEYGFGLEADREVVYTFAKDEYAIITSMLADVDGNPVFNDPSDWFGPVVIRIIYDNGEIELIGPYTSVQIKSDGKAYSKPYCFDYDGFKSVLLTFVDESALTFFE